MARTIQVKDIMTQPVNLASPDDTVEIAAQIMDDCDCGILPVGHDGRLVGMVTDRDIVTRAVAAGLDIAECTVDEIMTRNVKYCFEDETADDLVRNMRALQVKRLPVLNRQKRLVGIVSCGDLALAPNAEFQAAQALNGICQRSEGFAAAPI